MKRNRIEEMLDEVASNIKDLTRPEIRKAVNKTINKTLLAQELEIKRNKFRKNGYEGQVK